MSVLLWQTGEEAALLSLLFFPPKLLQCNMLYLKNRSLKDKSWCRMYDIHHVGLLVKREHDAVILSCLSAPANNSDLYAGQGLYNLGRDVRALQQPWVQEQSLGPCCCMHIACRRSS